MPRRGVEEPPFARRPSNFTIVHEMLSPFCYRTALLLSTLFLVGGAAVGGSSQRWSATAGGISADAVYQQGMRLLRARQYQQGLKRFKEVEQLSPQRPEGYTGEGVALALMGKPWEAVRVLEKAHQIDPSDWMPQRELGIIYWKLGRKSEAAEELTPIAKLFPTDSPVNLILAQYYFEDKQYSLANQFFLKAPARVATDLRLSLMAAEAQLQIGQLKQAAAQLQALSLTPNLRPGTRFQIGSMLIAAEDYPAALRVLESVPGNLKNPPARDYEIARAYSGEARYSDCIKVLLQLKAEGKTSPDLFNLLGVAEAKGGHTLAAYNAFREGIYRFPHDDENYLNIATLATQHLNYALAIEILSSGIREIPADGKLFLERGVIEALRGDTHSAQSDSRKAHSLAPTASNVYVALALCLMDQDKYTEAAAILRQGIQKGLRDTRIYFFLADALISQGIRASSPAYEEALDAIQAALRVDPDLADAYLERGRLRLMRGQNREAIADFQRAHMLAPYSKPILYQLAMAYRREGRNGDAGVLFREASESGQSTGSEYRKAQLVQTIVQVSRGVQSFR